MTEEDLTGICFKDNRWLEVFPLNKDTVLDYFALSGFYDRSCDNELLKMQRRLDPSIDPNWLNSKLQNLTGIQYSLVATQEPHLYSVKLLYYIQKAFKEAAAYASFDPYTNYTWNFDKQTGASTKPAPAPKAKDDLKVKEGRLRTDKIIGNLFTQFPIPSMQPILQPSTQSGETPQSATPKTPTPSTTTTTTTTATLTPTTTSAAPTVTNKRKLQDVSGVVEKRLKT